MSNIKSDIINNVTVTMSVYIHDREALDVLELVLANELMKVNVEEITTLPAEVKSSVDQVDMHTGDIPIIGEKGGRARTLYLDAEARYYLAAYLDERKDNSPYLFTQTVGAKRGRMGTATYRTIMRKIGKRAKIQSRVYPHKMRKTLGMDLKQHGLDIGIIQEILGHASPAVTSMYYAQSTTESLRSVRQRMSA